MNVLTLSTTYGLGGWLPEHPTGNVSEVSTAETDETGAWWVLSRDGSGELLTDPREATPEEAARFESKVNPTPEPAAPTAEALAAAEAFLGTLTVEAKSALAALLAR